jgi:hypothetical protein
MLHILHSTSHSKGILLLPFLFLLIAVTSQAAEAPSYSAERPKAAEILARLAEQNPAKRHPRLLAGAADFARVKGQISTDLFLKASFEKVKRAADKTLTEAPVKYELPDGVRLLSISRKALSRIMNLAFIYRMTGETKYADRAWLELETICDPLAFADWHPVHYLDTAEMAAAAAIGYDWLYDWLSGSQKETVRRAIERNAFSTALEIYNSGKGFPTFIHNWNAVCNGGLGLAALAIGDEEPALAKKAGLILEYAIRTLPNMQREFAPDGGWIEGVGYWGYANQYLSYLLSSLDLALANDYGLSGYPGFAETGFFPIYMTGSNSVFTFADEGRARYVKEPSLFWLARKFQRPEYTWYIMKYAGDSPLDLLWYQPEVKGVKPAVLDRYFRTVEVVGLHSRLGETDDIFIGFKAGNNQANHGDLDIGTFVIDAFGKRWAEDLGKDNYNLPGYFDRKAGGQRWTYYRKRAEGHNTLVINPSRIGEDQNVLAEAKLVRFETGMERSLAIADLTPAYKGKATLIRRGMMLFDKKTKIMIQDEIQAPSPVELWWFMHTDARIELLPGGDTAILSQDKQRFLIKLLSPQKAQFIIVDAVPLPTSPDPPGQEHQKKAGKKLAIHLKDVSSVTVTVLMAPLGEDLNLPELKVTVLPLADWK